MINNQKKENKQNKKEMNQQTYIYQDNGIKIK